jgi:uncharacterized membrane protein HdeD (DUF308 family)
LTRIKAPGRHARRIGTVEEDPAMTGTYRLHLRPSPGWGWLLAYGAVVILVGLAALLNPVATGVATGVMLALGLTFYGVIAIATALLFLMGGARVVELLLGAAALLAAFIIFDEPLAGALSLIWVIGVWLLMSGVFHIGSALRLPIHRGWRLFLGALDVVLGLFLLLDGPATGLFVLTLLVGVSFLSRGFALVGAAFALRRP